MRKLKKAGAPKTERALHTSASVEAYELIKQRLITLEYPPGRYLNEAQVCKDLGIGRTPVHHAVTRLALEGMLEIMPRKGIVVRPLSMEDALAVSEARIINEPACARLVAERITKKELADIQAIVRPAAAMSRSRDVPGLMNMDRMFHRALARACRNPVLEQILLRLHERSLRFWFVSLSDPEHLDRVASEHAAVIAALQSHDADKAETMMRLHIQSSQDHIRKSF